MKKIIRTVSLLAMLSLVAAFFTSEVHADYEYAEYSATVYNPSMVSYYWGWDRDWSVPYLTLSNGWHCSASQTLYGFTSGSYRGKVGYCIAPGVVFSDQAGYWSKEESYIDAVAEQNPILEKDDVIRLMGYVLGAAYKGDLKQSYYEDESSGKDAFGHIWSSQVLLWEIVCGERGSSFEYLGPEDGCSPCKDVIRPWSPIYESFASHYASMEAEVRKAVFDPSFSSEEDPPVYELSWNGSSYSAVLEDENSVLESYSVSCGDDSLRFSRDGNMLTVYSDRIISDPVKVSMTASYSSDNFLVMGSPGQNDFGAIKDNPQAYNQALLFNVSTVRVTKDPAFYVKTKGGEIRISKSSANCDLTEGNCNYSLEGAVYGVYTEGNEAQCSVNEESIIGCIVTDAYGNGSIAEGIAAGRRYYVREISAPRGYLLDEKVYSVVPEGEGENGAFIESAELPVNDPIAITLFKESAREGADIPSLEGTEFTVCYYDLDPDTEYGTDELDGMTPKKKWVITVKKSVYEGETVYKTQLSEEYLAEGSDSLFLSEGGEAILPVGYFTIKESKASEGYTVNLAKYYSGGELIAENNETIVGRVDYDGNISPEGINAGMYSVVNEPLDPESPDTGTSAGEYILLVISLAVLIAYIDFERSSAGKKAEKQN